MQGTLRGAESSELPEGRSSDSRSEPLCTWLLIMLTSALVGKPCVGSGAALDRDADGAIHGHLSTSSMQFIQSFGHDASIFFSEALWLTQARFGGYRRKRAARM